jgi:hypothetical protein
MFFIMVIQKISIPRSKILIERGASQASKVTKMTTRINEFAHGSRTVTAAFLVDLMGLAVCIICGIALAGISALSFAGQHKIIPVGILTGICAVAYVVAIPTFIKRFKAVIRSYKFERRASYLSELSEKLNYALCDEYRRYLVINSMLYLAAVDPDDESFISFFCVNATAELLHFSMRAELCTEIEYLDPFSGECDYSICDELFVNVYYRTRNEALSCLIDGISLE